MLRVQTGVPLTAGPRVRDHVSAAQRERVESQLKFAGGMVSAEENTYFLRAFEALGVADLCAKPELCKSTCCLIRLMLVELAH
jgi:hypothetical protein